MDGSILQGVDSWRCLQNDLGRVASIAGRIQVHACAPLVDLATADHVRRIAAAA